MNVIDKLTYWFFYNVVFALSPFLLEIVIASMKVKPWIFSNPLSNGQLMIVSTAIAADAYGQLLKSQVTGRPKMILGYGGLFLGLISAALFAAVSGNLTDFSGEIVTTYSTIIFAITFLNSAITKAIS